MIKGTTIKVKNTFFGVAQGTVTAQTTYIIATNATTKQVKQDPFVDAKTYADDTCLIITGKNTGDLEIFLNTTARVVGWLV